MKRSTVLTTVIAGLFTCWLFPSTAQSQRVPVVKDETFDFGVKVGHFAPLEATFDEIYGGGTVYGGELIVWSSSGIGGGVCFEFFERSGEPKIEVAPDTITGAPPYKKTEILIVPIGVSGMYRTPQFTPQSRVRAFFGIGTSVFIVYETLIVRSFEYMITASKPRFPVGFHTSGGIQIEISSSPIILLISEIKLSTFSLKLRGAGGIDANIDGVTAFVGVRF